MMADRFWRRLADRALSIVIGGAIVIGGMAAFGALASSDDTTFYACVDSRSGSLYNVSTSPDIICRSGHQSIFWSQTGPQGAPGSPGISNLTSIRAELDPLTTGLGNLTAICPEGLIPISGGYLLPEEAIPFPPGQSGAWTVLESYPVAGSANAFGFPVDTALDADAYGWRIFVRNDDTPFDLHLDVVVNCASVEVDA